MIKFYDVFISYGRADSKIFATYLNQRLIERGLKVWFDQNSIPPAVDFQNQIDDGIGRSHNFIFIIAPHSVKSIYCSKEIALAVRYNKRIIPIVHVNDDSYFELMHPTIKKINWLFFREEDDWEKNFKLLIELIERHQDYVHQHTQLLIQALQWLDNHKKHQYLLFNQNRSRAESWLKIKFENELAPCDPTELHCEYITESIRYANNLMTDVFICFNIKDKFIADKISKSLQRESLTIFAKDLDREQNLMAQALAEADNFIYLISENSYYSELCQNAFEQALIYHKPIIPVLISSTLEDNLDVKIKKLEIIKLFDSDNLEEYTVAISTIIKTLEENSFYYKTHKWLLTKALKWEKQNYNQSLLSRGHNLEHYQTWLKVAQVHPFHPPTDLQIKFLEASNNQPLNYSIEIFISYSRMDSDFARKINESLQELGKTTWFDQESIASGSNYEKEIQQGIANSDNFLFIISPNSVTSPYCGGEVEYAKQLNKRFITIVYEKVDVSSLHPELQRVQWIDFSQEDGDFLTNFHELVRTIETDRPHVQNHTKWLQRSREWELSKKNPDLLLRGTEFILAQNWLLETEKQNKQPPATLTQKVYINTSQKAIREAEEAEKRRQEEIIRLQKERAREAEARLAEQKKRVKVQNRLLIAIISALVIVIGLGLETYKQYQKSRWNEIKALAAYSQSLFARNFQLTALTNAIKAGEKLQQLGAKDSEVESTIKQVVYRIAEYNHLIGHQGNILAVQFSPDGQKLVTASDDNTVKLWRSDGQLIKTLFKHNGSVNSVAFSPDGKFLVSGSVDNTIIVWKEDGSYLSTLRGHTKEVTSVAFSPDSQLIVSGSRDKTIRLWKRQNLGTTYKEYKSRNVGNEVNSVAFSPDGQLIAFGNKNGKVNLWKREGTFLKTIGSHQAKITKVVFSPDGRFLASASWDETIQLWQQDDKNSSNYVKSQTLSSDGGVVGDIAFNRTGQYMLTGSQNAAIELWQNNGFQWNWAYGLYGRETDVKAVAFNPFFTIDTKDTKNIAFASASAGNIVQLWKPNTNKLLKFGIGHGSTVSDIDISPNEQVVASASLDKTIKLWQINTNLKNIKTLTKEHTASVTAIKISPDGQLIASGSTDDTVKLWTIEGKFLKTLHHEDDVYDVTISPDSQWIISGSRDKTIKIWGREGTLKMTLTGHTDAVKIVTISPDGQLIASGSGDNTIKIWSKDGKLLITLLGHKSPVLGLDFSPNSQLLVSGSEDNKIKLWKRNNTSAELVPHPNKFSFDKDLGDDHESVLNVKFSPDGQYIASANDGGIIKLRDLDGNLKSIYPGHQNQVYGINFSANGKAMVSGGADQIVILWNLTDQVNLDRLLQDGCDWLKDYLKHHQSQKPPNICKN